MEKEKSNHIGSRSVAMGCSNSKSTNVNMSNMQSSLLSKLLNSTIIQELSRNALASVLNKYPEAKHIFHVPETAKNESELAKMKEVKAASDQLLNHYMEIGKSTGTNFDETVRKKADELHQQGVKAEYIKTYGENLAQNVVKDTKNQLTKEEENLWKTMTDQVTNKLTTAMNKLPSAAS